jgi:F0F1-type ATP synthase assembly protein I
MLDDKDKKEFRREFEASAIGWMFPISMALGFGIGYGLDKKVFHTWPWLTIFFSACGVIAAFVNLFRLGGGPDGS